MAKDIPVFEGTERERLEKCIEWVKKSIMLKRWTNKQIDRLFSKRNIRQVLGSGHTFYMNSCLDRTLVLLEVMKRNGFSPTMIAELLEVKGIKAPHFAVEVKVDCKLFTAQFTTGGISTISQGIYSSFKQGQPGVRSLETYRIQGKLFSLEKNFFEAIKGTAAETGIAEVDMNAIVEKMKKDNTLGRAFRFEIMRKAEKFRRPRRNRRP